MATEILVNDGGAPARILPFIASHAITGGELCISHTDGKLQKATSAASNWLGVALTDAAADGPVNLITGRGVILNVFVSGAANIGAQLETGAGSGVLVAGATAGKKVAIALAAGPGGSDVALTKVLMVGG